DVVAALRSGCAVDVGTTPRVVGHARASQIRPIPTRTIARALHQRAQTFRIRGVLTRIKKIQIERVRETFNLNSGGLDFRFTHVIEDARADESHDQSDDRDDDDNLNECKSLLAMPRRSLASLA